ncbi:MAG: PQQ-binding-like beta-propeller repeat protein [Bacteroidetes bacterium]|nr:PQQ-binding-like beta-propeller repeat protein [Bacteroidota bacterium]
MNPKRVYLLLLIIPFIYSCTPNVESQRKGPQRNSIFPETGLLQEWPEEGPDLLWRYDSLGMGHSSAAVTNENIYITGMPDSTGGILYCLDLEGNLLWEDKFGKDWNINFTGTRATPTIVGNHLYFISSVGEINCYDLKKHAKVWTKSYQEDFNSSSMEYGIAESPLVVGDKFYCTPGGEEYNVVCLDRFSGDLIWSCKGNGEEATYSSSILAVHNGRKIVVTVTEKSILGIDANKGELLWTIPFQSGHVVHVNTPVYYEGKIYMASEALKGKGGFVAIELSEDGSAATILWKRGDLRNMLSGFIILDNYIYSSIYMEDNWHCLNALTGETEYTWKDNYGSISYADNRFYILGNMGDVALWEGSPQEFKTISIFRLDIKPYYPFALLWAPPVIKNKRLYIRHKGSLFVYDIAQN